MAHILLVEDDVMINQVVTEFLKEDGHTVISVFDGKEALDYFEKEEFALIILDIMIPSISGLDVLKKIRESSQVPIMMLTAMNDEYTQLISFNHLISDYVVKPFSPVILMKRIENILRQKNEPEEMIVGNLVVRPDEATAYVSGEALQLTKTEYEILELLVRHRGKLVTRDHLMNEIWGYSELDSRVLDNHIKNLRKKVSAIQIRTVIGRGYQVDEDI